jgi:CRISPR-associated protein Cas1
MSTLYVVEAGARLEKEYGRLLVTLNDEVILRVPAGTVSRVVFVGRVGATTAALHALLAEGIPLVFISRSGQLLGQLAPPMPGNLPLRQAQYRRDDDTAFCFGLARSVAAGKLRNQRTLAARLARRPARPGANPDRPEGIAAQLAELIARAETAPDMDTLRGIEGHGARLYFRALRAAFAPDWGFDKRTRRPPRDPINALLSLGYSLLTQNMMAALEIVGLDPYLGYYHAETYGRPALALDLVEEFRAPVVDSLVLWVINQRILQPDDFRPDEATGGVALTDRGLREYLVQFSGKLESTVLVRELDRRLTYRKLFDVQARRLARHITGDDETYRPFRAR